MNEDGVKRKYRKNFLEKVLYKADFEKCLDISTVSIKKYKTALGNEYDPLSEIEQQGFTVQGDSSGVKTEPKTEVHWKIESKQNSHYLEIDDSSFAIVFTKYVKFADYISIVATLHNEFFSVFPNIQSLNRIGLRYINNIKIPSPVFSKWSDYINPHLATSFEFYKENPSILRRSMHIDAVEHDDETRLNINYGLFNSYFPAPMVDNSFILDIDVFSAYQVSPKDGVKILTDFNKVVAIYFEKSVTEKLRQLMEVVDAE